MRARFGGYEWRILAALGLKRGVIHTTELRPLFTRGRAGLDNMADALRSLQTAGLLVHDPAAGLVRWLELPLLRALGLSPASCQADSSCHLPSAHLPSDQLSLEPLESKPLDQPLAETYSVQSPQSAVHSPAAGPAEKSYSQCAKSFLGAENFLRTDSVPVASVASVASSDHLASETDVSHLTGDQLTGAKSFSHGGGRPAREAPAEEIVAWLARITPADIWREWAGWWVTVARKNPERIERAYTKLTSDVRSPGAFMRARIQEYQEGLG